MRSLLPHSGQDRTHSRSPILGLMMTVLIGGAVLITCLTGCGSSNNTFNPSLIRTGEPTPTPASSTSPTPTLSPTPTPTPTGTASSGPGDLSGVID
jgi:hypothetical protein